MSNELTQADLLRWADALAGTARTGLAFTENLYERERFQEIVQIAAEIRARAADGYDADSLAEEWLIEVGSGVPGYVTPKATVGAVVGNEAGEILLVQRADSGVWLYPTGWADVGYSPSELVVKEVHEETGIDCVPERIIAVLDGQRRRFTSIPLYSIVFLCRAVGGELRRHPLECSDAGWFARDALPEPLAGGAQWVELAFAALDGVSRPVEFDPPRTPIWRGDSAAELTGTNNPATNNPATNNPATNDTEDNP